MTSEQQSLVTQNLGLVRRIAFEYVNDINNMDELFQVGCEALCNAAQKENIRASFSTYAYTCIKNAIRNYAMRQSFTASNELPYSTEDYDNEKNANLAVYDSYKDAKLFDVLQDIKSKSKKQMRIGIDILTFMSCGYSKEEICQKLDISQRQYKRCLEISRKKLREKLILELS